MGAKLPMVFTAGVAALLAACSTAPVEQSRSPQASKELADALAGRVAGPPQRCISTYRNTKVQPIDDFTILYDQGSTIYVQNPRGGCPGVGSGSDVLVTRQVTNQICDDLVAKLSPRRMTVVGDFAVRGGTQGIITVTYTKSS